jgi:vancomycin permeability regulator SanA
VEMAQKGKKLVTAVIIITLILNLVILFFIKYKNQGLYISQFRWSTIGNLLNLVFTSLLIICILIYSAKKSIDYNAAVLIWFTVIISTLLIISSVITMIPIKQSGIYILDHPLNKFVAGALFFLFQFVQIFFMVYISLEIFGSESSRVQIILSAIVDSVIIFFGLLIFAYLFSYLNKDKKENLYPENNSIAVVLGAAVWSHNKPSPSLEGRAEKAIELYQKGIVDKIQVTGSNAPGELSEARVAFNYLIKKGVEPEKVWIEDKTTSTEEQIHFIKEELILNRRINNIIIISDSYHLPRVEEICKFYNIKIRVAASDFKLDFDSRIYNYIRESVALFTFWLFAL